MKSAQPHALAPYAGMNKEDLLRYIDLFKVEVFIRDIPQEELLDSIERGLQVSLNFPETTCHSSKFNVSSVAK